MPWSKANLPEHVKKLGEKQQRQWMHVANGCLEDGGEEGRCIKMANGVVKKEIDDFYKGSLMADSTLKELNDLKASLDSGLLKDEDILTAAKSYQYVDSYEYETRKLSQSEANYRPTGGGKSQACSNCKFFVSPARCTVVSGEIAPNGLSDMWQAVPTYVPEPIPVVIVGGMKEQKEPSFVDKVKAGIASLIGVTPEPNSPLGLTIFKQADGSYRWFARYSNSWEDRDKELITQDAHKEFVEWATSNKMYPELWLWHTPGTRFGVADWLDFSDGFAHASGVVDDTPQAKSTVEYLSTLPAGYLGVSHGFQCKQDGRFITKYRSFEVSVLPSEVASALGTDFNVFGKETDIMAFSKTQREFLVANMGEEAVTQLEARSEKAASALKATGLAFKEAEGVEQAKEQVTSNEGIKELTALVAQTLSTVNELSESIVGVKAIAEEALTTAKKSKDETVEDEFLARVAKAVQVARPTDSKSNEVDAAKAKELGTPAATAPIPGIDPNDFFGSQILAGLGAAGAAQTAIGGVGSPAVAAVTTGQ